MSRKRWIAAGAAFVLVIAVIVTALVLRTGPTTPQPTSFPPWYPMANGDGDPADFENHVPCEIDPAPFEGCDRVKFGVVLYRDADTDEPTTFLISIVRVGAGDDRETIEGTWRITEGTALDPQDLVYELDTAAPGHLRNYWPIGDNILFMLDEQLMPRVGDAAYGYALNSVPLGQRNTVPEG